MSDANDMIRRMPGAFDPGAAGDLHMTVQYMTEQPMFVTIAAGECRVHEGLADAPDVTLRIRGDHLVKLMTGRMRGITAFLTGRLKVEGNMMLAQKLQHVFDRERLA
ncbi:SCP2 sterol-binding domain-containing protein [Salinisphaera aquimarina]|uniref:SCP2 sterol-binding domain-containing protein n=1 Tax=Salinisphaera aquimarina TaxID=2094031 RepID=A0ABV7EUR1_9GAMM